MSAHKPTAEAKEDLKRWRRSEGTDLDAGKRFFAAIKHDNTALDNCGACQEEYNTMVAALKQAGAL